MAHFTVDFILFLTLFITVWHIFSVWNFSVLFCFVLYLSQSESLCGGGERYKLTLIILANLFSPNLSFSHGNQYLHWPKASSIVSWPLSPSAGWPLRKLLSILGWSAWQPVPLTRIYTAPFPKTSSGGRHGPPLKAPARALLLGLGSRWGLDHGRVLGHGQGSATGPNAWRSLLSKFKVWLVSMAPLFYPKALSLICAINSLFNSRDQREIISAWISS